MVGKSLRRRHRALSIQADSIIIAVSQAPGNNLKGIEIGKSGLVITDEVGRTTREGIFASGDVVTGAKTVAEAVRLSKRSAAAIMNIWRLPVSGMNLL
ncbi:MAG: FAD-dependent oxidoreductase [Syntrophotaleaceae bacterium]